MLGQAIGYLSTHSPPLIHTPLFKLRADIFTPLPPAGGMIGDAIDIRAPFDVAFLSFILSGIYVGLALPYIAPDAMSNGKNPSKGGLSGFLAPLKILVPRRLRLADGRMKKHYGIIFLSAGIFLGVVC